MGADVPMEKISIHAPRVRSDLLLIILNTFFKISIHAPRVRSDFSRADKAVLRMIFQSTLLG